VKMYAGAQIALKATLTQEPPAAEPVPPPIAPFLRNARMETIEITADSPAAGKLIREVGLRSRTGASAVGIERGRVRQRVDPARHAADHDRGTRDPRESRAGALNIIPTDTGAARALGRVIPALQGRFDGMAFRVPTPTVSTIDFVCELERPVSKATVIEAFRDAAEGRMRGLLGVSEQPLVSMDYKGDERSAIVDALATMVLGDRVVKVIAWYDNEWGYASRVRDLIRFVATTL